MYQNRTMNNVNDNITILQRICSEFPKNCAVISEHDFAYKPMPEKWSKKEILGHLIDSATNNHHRFVRAQFEDVPHIVYNQNNWNEYSRYRIMETKHLLMFWEVYNRHLIEILKAMPQECYTKECDTGDAEPHTLEWLFDDYVRHLEYHIKQVLE